MSISDNYAPDKSLGNSSTVEFTGNWSPLVASYFKLALEAVATGVQTLQTQGDDYTLTFDDDGYIATMDTAPSSDYYVVRYREIEQNQTVPLRTSKGFQGYVHENALDKLTAIDQDQQDAISRTLKFQVGATGITNAILPAPVDGYGIVWDGTDGSMKNTAASLAALESIAVIVAENIANINTVAENDANITLAATLAPLTEEISIIADNIGDFQVVADALSDSIASGITYSHTTSGLAATNVQTAIDELASEKLNALFASQAEAEAGTAEDKPLNALRTKQAIAALAQQSGSATDGQVLTANGSGGSAWETPTAAVTSVAGKTGVVTLDKSDVGLGNVANVNTTVASNITSGILPGARLPQGDDSIGSYALMENVSGSTISGGSTQAGSGLRHAIFTSAGVLDGGTTAGAGTWENMSKDPVVAGGFGLFQRIS